MKLKEFASKIYFRLNRNRMDQEGRRFIPNRINLIYWKRCVNLGDTLAPLIFEWILQQKSLSVDSPVKKTQALTTVGSIIDLGRFDTVVWGSGLQSFEAIKNLSKRKYRRLDIRAVRGPLTRQMLHACNYDCPEIYGDPAILMPLIYLPSSGERSEKKVVLIYHHSMVYDTDIELTSSKPIEVLDIKTQDYKAFIDTICSAGKVISSSLHGIILAESYGIPAVFLCNESEMTNATKEILKFYDWYYSTGRFTVKVARSIEEAIQMQPMDLPDLEEMRSRLLQAFPYDLWEML